MTPRSLDDRLQALRAALDDHQPPSAVDRAIEKAIAAKPRSTRRAAPGLRERWLAWPLALAASIFAISFVVRQSPPEELASAETLREAARAFMPIASADEIALARDAYLLHARLPRMTIAQFGFPVDPMRIGEAVDAELLVRPDGAVLALRFVP